MYGQAYTYMYILRSAYFISLVIVLYSILYIYLFPFVDQDHSWIIGLRAPSLYQREQSLALVCGLAATHVIPNNLLSDWIFHLSIRLHTSPFSLKLHCKRNLAFELLRTDLFWIWIYLLYPYTYKGSAYSTSIEFKWKRPQAG